MTTDVLWVCCDPLPPICFNSIREVLIGRDAKCDLVLPHKTVSRHHAVIKCIDGRNLLLEDLGSSNGTFLNAKMVSSSKLQVADVISIGPYELEVTTRPRKVGTDRLGITDTKMFAHPQTATISGQLNKISLVEVLQSVEFYEKTGTLVVNCKSADGWLVFGAGRPIAAEFAGLKGLSAVFSMLSLTEGQFLLTDMVEPTEPTINTSITNILLEHSRVADESSTDLGATILTKEYK